MMNPQYFFVMHIGIAYIAQNLKYGVDECQGLRPEIMSVLIKGL